MVRFLKWVVIAPFAILFLAFAFANRHIVTISFDPLTSGDIPAFSIPAPLFVVIIGSIAIGVVAGGIATWFSQGKHRRALREMRAQADKLRSDLQAAKAALPPPPPLLSKRA